MAEEDIMQMENLILAMAYAPGKSGQVAEPLRGKTVLQKLLFHVKRALEPDRPAAELPHFYGPFSEQAEVVAEQLEPASGVYDEDIEVPVPVIIGDREGCSIGYPLGQ